ncbi:MAG TPA: YceI family protein [Gemmatimonadales bacterium]|nr:YceI family protein [Gemmatimonadales bacterium]
MKYSCWSFLLVVGAGAAAPVPTAAQPPWPDAGLRTGRLSFDGKATLGDFTGVTDSVRGYMTGGARLRDVRGWVEAPVRTLKTGNNRRDRDLYSTMDADILPLLRFQLEGVEPEWERGDSAAVLLSGSFVIHGVSRPERVMALVHRTGDGIRITASLPMNLKDYGIGGLTRFLVFRMRPDIMVNVDLTFRR